MTRIGVLDGPNLDRLGGRESTHYGESTLGEIRESLRASAPDSVELVFFQSNHEGELVDWLGQEAGELDGLLVNAGALTHTSLVLRDALEAAGVPFVEVHLSNVHAREEFRRRSYLADRAVGIVAGFRDASYRLALRGLLSRLEESAGP